MKLATLFEAKHPATKAAKIWLKVSDLMVDLEDELLDLSKTDPRGAEALQHLRNNDLQSLHRLLRNMFVPGR